MLLLKKILKIIIKNSKCEHHDDVADTIGKSTHIKCELKLPVYMNYYPELRTDRNEFA